MRIVMASSEATPLAKTGGLADVVGALPGALRRLGHDVSVVLPAFRGALERSRAEPTEIRLSVPVSNRVVGADVYRGALADGTPVHLVRRDAYFDRDGLYGTAAGDYADNAERFAFFSRAVLALLDAVGPPDVLHCHDWQTALAPVFLRADSPRYPRLGSVRTVVTVHNLGYQGFFWALDWHLLNLDFGLFNPGQLEFWGHIDYLKGGLVFADALTTVSPRYAEEICTPELGHGLDGVLRQRRAVLRGILNGVDYAEWSPETDGHLPAPFSRTDLGGKATCKRGVQREMGLAEDPDVPLLAMVTRLAGQKGLDLLLPLGDELLQRGVQLAILGTGEAVFEDGLRTLAGRGAGRVAVHIGFDEALAHRLQGGADMLLMPSRYEPCGLNQIYALRYGTLPIVRATGGLDDTVDDYDPATDSGTGFKFSPYTPAALLAAIDRARGWYARRPVWSALMQRAMAADFSWQRSAAQYAEVFRSLSPPA